MLSKDYKKSVILLFTGNTNIDTEYIVYCENYEFLGDDTTSLILFSKLSEIIKGR